MPSAIALSAPPAAAQQVTTYVYDAVGRVTSATYPNGATVAYTYDNADNRTRAQTTGAMAARPVDPAAPTRALAAAPAKGGAKAR